MIEELAFLVGALLTVFVLARVFVGFLASLAARASRSGPVAPRPEGDPGVLGRRGKVHAATEARGKVRVRGELWHSRSETRLRPGDEVEVVGVDGITLRVRPVARLGSNGGGGDG